MRLRCGRTSARGSAGKPAGGGASGPSSAAAAPSPWPALPAARDAANRSAPSASKTPAWSATVTGASLSAAIPAAMGVMRAPCPIRTTGPSILLLS